MARLVNARTGSVVVVPEEKVANLLFSGYFVKEKVTAKKAPAKKAAPKKSEE